MDLIELLLALVIAVGIAGVVVPVLPGTLLVLGAVIAWAVHVGTSTGWVVAVIATVLLALGSIVKFTIPGKRLQAAGVPSRTLWAGAGAGVIGFFVVPVVGLFVGFVLGVYAAEHHRVGAAAAWPSTKAALRAVAASMLIELVAASLAALTWVVGVVVT